MEGSLVLPVVSLLFSPVTFEGLKTNFNDRLDVPVDRQEARLAEVCTDALDSAVRVILSKIDVNVSHDVNAKILSPYHVPQLLRTYNHLLNIDENFSKHQLLKSGFIVNILKELHKLLLYKCNYCGDICKNDCGVSSPVSCSICGTGAHSECYTEPLTG